MLLPFCINDMVLQSCILNFPSCASHPSTWYFKLRPKLPYENMEIRHSVATQCFMHSVASSCAPLFPVPVSYISPSRFGSEWGSLYLGVSVSVVRAKITGMARQCCNSLSLVTLVNCFLPFWFYQGQEEAGSKSRRWGEEWERTSTFQHEGLKC
jgi:hypothetical protein